MKRVNIILGGQFGDEGKGSTTYKTFDWSKREFGSALNIRFSGGPQIGHTVNTDSFSHIHKVYGSAYGIKGGDTLLTKDCCFDPSILIQEKQILFHKRRHVNNIFVEAECPLITPLDVIFQRFKTSKKGGKFINCGFGVGEVKSRMLKGFNIYLRDCLFPFVLKQKLHNLLDFYFEEGKDFLFKEFFQMNYLLCDEMFEDFCFSSHSLLKSFGFKMLKNDDETGALLRKYNSFVFEGSQGILLDKDYGFFPYVTYSNTTDKGAIDFINRFLSFDKDEISRTFCIRSYLTRHGDGFNPKPFEEDFKDFNFEDKTNFRNEFQGDFKIGYHNSELLDYAKSLISLNKDIDNVSISCLDQSRNMIFLDGSSITLYDFLEEKFKGFLEKGNVLLSKNNNSSLIEKIKI